MTKDVFLVLCACASEEEAAHIAQKVVEQRLAACVNIIPGVQSVFHWEGKLCKESEYLLLIKTTQDAYHRLEQNIMKLHSYDCPEIIAFRVEKGNPAYMDWVRGWSQSSS